MDPHRPKLVRKAGEFSSASAPSSRCDPRYAKLIGFPPKNRFDIDRNSHFHVMQAVMPYIVLIQLAFLLLGLCPEHTIEASLTLVLAVQVLGRGVRWRAHRAFRVRACHRAIHFGDSKIGE